MKLYTRCRRRKKIHEASKTGHCIVCTTIHNMSV